MNRATSTYLDAVRLSAALVVMFSHFGQGVLGGGFLWQIKPFGSQAVDVFFVLSGFVIGYVTREKERDATTYAIARAARIGSVAFPALAATLLLDWIGTTIDPGLYPQLRPGAVTGDPRAFGLSLLFLNETWQHVVPGSNEPYWSLGFEVWYYVIFGIVAFASGRRRWLLVPAALMIAGPKVAMLFPLWLLGVATHSASRRLRIGLAGSATLFVGSAALALAWAGWRLWRMHNGLPIVNDGAYDRPIFDWPAIAIDYGAGLLFAANLLGFSITSARLGVRGGGRLGAIISWAAGATFTLYLLHFPLLVFFAAISPWPVATTAYRLYLPLATLVTVFLVAEVTERRKRAWRRLFTGVAVALGGRVPVRPTG